MKACTLEWLFVVAAMIVFTVLALNGQWTDLGLALTIAAVLWYTVVPEYQAKRQ